MPETEKRQMKIKCPSCGSKLDVTDIEPFTVVPCPQCGYEVTIPKRFLSYVLEERLEAKGGICRYRALEESLDREVYVVTCDVSEATPQERLEQYLETLRKAASQEIAGTAAVYACGRTGNGVYAVSQMASRTAGGDAQLAWKEARTLIAAFALILQKLAEAGVVHGALGEQSFCVDDHGNPLLCGLGEGVLLAGRLLDNPYASPERRDGGGCTLAADLYGFGVWCVRLLTGRTPTCEMDIDCLRDVLPDVPLNVVGVLGRMMSRSVLRRPHGYGSLLSELRIAEQTSSGKAKVMCVRRDEREGQLVSAEKSAGWCVPLMVVLFLLMFGGAGGWMAWQMVRKPNETPRPSLDLQRKEAVAEEEETVMADEAVDGVAHTAIESLPQEYRRQRPRPDDLRFDDDAVQKYLLLIPESSRLVEKERLARIIGIREYLFSLLRMPCRPEKSRGLRLRDGSFIKGYVAMGAESSGLAIRPLDGERQSLQVTSIRLEELEWSEIWRMLDFYGQERKAMGQRGVQTNREIFEHYLNSALVCEWYGYRKEAVVFARKAMAAKPDGRNVVEKFGLIKK